MILACGALLAGATAGMLAGVEPFATWYYQLAWYPTLFAADAVVRLRTGRFFLLDRPRFTLALFAWSVPFWLLFETLNFRMANWYYVFLPADPVARWTGIFIAFATVLPAILLVERLLAALGLRGLRTPRLPTGPGLPAALQAIGVLMVAVALLWPRIFYPLIWGAVTLLLDPVVYRHDRSRSLVADLERGAPARIVRLLVGGLAIGIFWEMFNAQARSKWIYTVPGLEDLKLFEMPVAGFLGFPVLALDGWAAWQTLVVTGLAPTGLSTRSGPTPIRSRGAPTRTGLTPPTRLVTAVLALVFSGAVLLGMERFTNSSYAPDIRDLPGIEAGPLVGAGYDAFELAEVAPADVARLAGIPALDAERAVERARLATLRGIGTDNARRLIDIGVGSVDDLAAADPDRLTERLRGLTPDARHPARIRVWIRAARAEAARPLP